MGEIEKSVSLWLGLGNVPLGLGQVIVALGLYVPITQKFGTLPVVTVAGIVATALYPLMGFWCDEMWKVFLICSLIGCCFGFIVPACGPLCARYSQAAYPTQMA